MATDDILVRYRSDVSSLEADLDKVIELQGDITDGTNEQERATKRLIASIKKSFQETGKVATISSADVKKTGLSFDQLNKKIKAALDPKPAKEFSKEINNVASTTTKAGGTIGNVFKGLATGLAAAFSAAAIGRFTKASIDAFLEQEKAIERLRFAIIGMGGESEQVFDRLVRQSNEVQKISIFGDDAIQRAQAALASFGLTGRQIEELIPKLADFATVTGTDIAQAAQQVGQGLQGAGREFKKFGIEVSATNTPLENYDNIVRGLVGQQGAAEAATKTLSGQMEQLKNRSGDLQEELGAKLAPVFVKLKVALFEATLGLLGFNKAADQLKDDKITDLERSYALTAQRITSSGGDVVDVFTKAAQKIEDQNGALEKQIIELEKKRGSNIALVNNLKEQVELNKQKATILKNIVDRTNEANSQNERTLTLERLQVLSISELNRLLKENKDANDIIAQSNVRLINEELSARQKLSDEIRKLREKQTAEEKKAYEDQFNELKKSLDKGLDELEAFYRKQKQDAKDLAELFEFEVRFTAAVEGEDVALEKARSKLFAIYQDEIIGAQVTSQTVEEENAKKQKAYEEYIANLTKLVGGFAMFEQGQAEETAQTTAQIWLDKNREIITASAQLFSELANLYSTFAQREIEAVERAKEAQLNSIDEQLKTNDEALEKRRISEKEAAVNEQRLLAEKVRAEEAADKKIRDLKRKQFLADRAQALANIAISTAENIVETPLLTALYLALAAAQTAVVLAQPVPYAKGSKDTGSKGHMAKVGERGEEIVYMPPNSKVLPDKQTRKYSDVLDAMFDNNLDKYIWKHHVTPALIEQKRAFENEKSHDFATNIAKSVYYQSGLTSLDLEQSRRKGQPVTNTKQLAKDIGIEIGSVINNRDIYR